MISAEFEHVNARKLRSARAYLHWNLDKAAAASGVDRITIYRAENGIQKTRAETLRQLVETYAKHGVNFTEDGLSFGRELEAVK